MQCVKVCPAAKPYYDFTLTNYPCVHHCDLSPGASIVEDSDDTVTKKLTTLTYGSLSKLACVSSCADLDLGDATSYDSTRDKFVRRTFQDSTNASF
jgi:hypothetical protein